MEEFEDDDEDFQTIENNYEGNFAYEDDDLTVEMVEEEINDMHDRLSFLEQSMKIMKERLKQ